MLHECERVEIKQILLKMNCAQYYQSYVNCNNLLNNLASQCCSPGNLYIYIYVYKVYSGNYNRVINSMQIHCGHMFELDRNSRCDNSTMTLDDGTANKPLYNLWPVQ